MNKKIYAVLVTYNRKEYLNKLLANLVNNSLLSGILILDNNSTDGTENSLIEKKIIEDATKEKLHVSKYNEKTILYYKNNENTGGAGGFNKAFSIISNFDLDYIWVMDDDVMPGKNCLNKLIDNMSEEVAICIPNRSDENYNDIAVVDFNLSNPFLINQKRKKIVRKFSDDNVISVVDMPFEGPLIKFEVVKKVGLPNEKMFIFYDDTDYARRCLQFGKILFVKNAILHKQIIPKIENSYEFNWRSYYMYRNSMYFENKYGKNIIVRKVNPFLTYFFASIKSIFKFKFKNLKILKMAYKDYKNKNFGKTVNPGDF